MAETNRQVVPVDTNLPKTDVLRPEGVYAKWFTYPEHSGLQDNLFLIERVCGDTSVPSVTLTRGEARTLFHILQETFK